MEFSISVRSSGWEKVLFTKIMTCLQDFYDNQESERTYGGIVYKIHDYLKYLETTETEQSSERCARPILYLKEF